MARMWMVRGEGGSLYDAFRERGVAAVGWNQLAAHAKPGVGRKQLIALYQSAEPQAKQGTVVSEPVHNLRVKAVVLTKSRLQGANRSRSGATARICNAADG